MIRETLNGNSRNEFMGVSLGLPTPGFTSQRRTTTGGSSVTSPAGTANASPNNWVRITRAGNTFTVYKSSNGTSWTQVASTTITMGSSVSIGLAVTSHNNSTLSTAVFDNVTVVP
jgi:regulation of enolase protein 1 (concanavalin A-like superfamily)